MFNLYLKILKFEINILKLSQLPSVLSIIISYNKIGKVKEIRKKIIILQSGLFQLNTVCLIFLTDFFSV